MKSILSKNFCKVIQKHGWILIRITGSHHIFVKTETKTTIVVPVHAKENLKIGVLKQLLKRTNLTESDF